MSAWINPLDRRRGVATVAAGATVVAVALGAAACAGTPAVSSDQASLSAQQAAAAMPSVVMTPTTASTTLAQSAAAGPGAGHAKSPGPSTAPSGPAASQTSPAHSASPTWAASAAPSTAPAAGSATGATEPAPATSGSSTGTLSLSLGCAAQTTIQVLSSFSCPITVSGGTPGYGWTLFVNGQDAALDGTLPLGLETTDTDTTFTIEGKPGQWGTFTFAVTVTDNTATWPPHTASTSFTLIVPEPPPQDRMP
jgi:hypothetical protein